MDHAGVDAVDEIRLAGAFGSQIDAIHAMVLGLIPDCDLGACPVGRQRRRHRARSSPSCRAPPGPRSRRSSGGSRRSRRRSSRASRSTSSTRSRSPTGRPRSTHLARVVDLPRAPDRARRRRARRARARAGVAGRPRPSGRTTDDRRRPPAPVRRPRGPPGAPALHAHAERTPFLTRTLDAVRGPRRGGPRADRAQRRHDPRGGRARVPRRRRRPLRLFRDAGADVDGERVRFPRGMCRRSSRRPLPRSSPSTPGTTPTTSRSGGSATVFAPNYGSPFVRDLDRGRRYGTIEDFRNFVKLAYASPHLHHSRRDGLRAGRRAGQQAPPRHGLRPHPLLGQAVHGLGHRPGARPRHGRDGPDRVRRRLPRGPRRSS